MDMLHFTIRPTFPNVKIMTRATRSTAIRGNENQRAWQFHLPELPSYTTKKKPETQPRKAVLEFYGRPAFRQAGRLIEVFVRSVGRLVGRLVGRPTDWSVGWPARWSFGWFVRPLLLR